MPVRRVKRREGPMNANRREPVFDHPVVGDVIVIVKIHKAVVQHRQVNRQRDEREQQRDEARREQGVGLV